MSQIASWGGPPGQLTTSQWRTLLVTLNVTSVVELCGALCLLFLYYSVKSLRNTTFLLVSILSFTNVCQCVAYLVSNFVDWQYDFAVQHTNVLCEFQGATLQYFRISSFSWTVCIAHALFSHLVKRRASVLKKSILWYHVLSWIAPLFLALACLPAYAPVAAWCFVEDGYYRAIFYLPLALAMSYCLVVFVVARRRLQRLSASPSAPLQEWLAHRNTVLASRLLWLLPVFVALWLPVFIYQALVVFSPMTMQDHGMIIFMLNAVTCPLQGFWNMVVFLSLIRRQNLAREQARWWRRQKLCCYCRCCRCCHGDGDDDPLLSDSGASRRTLGGGASGQSRAWEEATLSSSSYES